MQSVLNSNAHMAYADYLNHASIDQTVLGKIIAAKQQWLIKQKRAKPLAQFQTELAPSDRDFMAALKQPGSAFILECKKASPSKGLIRADFDLEAIADVYRQHANVISVLTDEPFFQGDFSYLPRVRARVSQPILCKDFIIDPYQVYLARHYQADAILLMLSVLSDEGYLALSAIASSLGLGILTEVSNEEEVARAIALNAPVIGINNRDLRNLSVDLTRTVQLAAQIPDDRIIISESGITDRSQVVTLRRYVKGFLVGSSLMAQANLAHAVQKLTLGENKICGLTRAQDAHHAYQAGAIYGGLIFVSKSPRCVDSEQARTIMASAPLAYVGVFQNAPLEWVAQTANQLKLAAVQLHGDEDPDYLNVLRPQLPSDCQIWKAIGIAKGQPLPSLDYPADRLLIDSVVKQGSSQQSGGTGTVSDWSLLASLNKHNVMLAGGLTADNALSGAQVGCVGLDFNSGLESAPGIKDEQKITAAFAALRQL